MELLYNAGALLDAGAMTGDTYLAVLEKLVDDPEPLVVQAALAGMQTVRGAFIEPEMEDAFARYVDRALSPPLARFGVERRADEAETVSLVRGPLLLRLARDGRNARARALGDSLARAYLADPGSIDPGLSGAAIEIAALAGDDVLWETYRERFEGATNPGQRRLFLSALGAFPDPAIRDRAFAYSLTGPLRPQEQFTIARAALDLSEANRDAAYTWVVTNYEAIRSRIPPMNAVFIPLIADGCSAERLVRAQEFFAQPAHAPGGTEKEMAKVTESIEDCVALRKREGERVRAYLNRIGVAN
jgi:alanyl aminopeptidase